MLKRFHGFYLTADLDAFAINIRPNGKGTWQIAAGYVIVTGNE